MNKKIAFALAFMATILLTSFAFENVPSVHGQSTETVVVMGGTAETCSQLIQLGESLNISYWTIPYETRDPYFTPGEIYFDQEASAPDGNGVVKLNRPKDAYHGVYHIFCDKSTTPHRFYKVTFANLTMNGTGWIFTHDNYADVDIITFTNDTGTYFYGPDGKHNIPKDGTWADDLPAMDSSGNLLQLGADGIPGTSDDPPGSWGTYPRTPEPKGHSITYFPTKLVVYLWDFPNAGQWNPLMPPALYPELTTTGTANCTVLEPASAFYPGSPPPANRPPPGSPLLSAEMSGQPIEYFTSGKAWGDPQSNIFSIHVCCWGWLNINTNVGPLDLFWKLKMISVKKTVYDTVMGDADLAGLESPPYFFKVDMMDISMACYAAFTHDEGLDYPTPPPPFYEDASLRFDARCDVDMNSRVDMMDISIMCYNFLHEYKMTP